MKRFFKTLVVVAAIALFATPVNAYAGDKPLQFGVKAGLNFTNMSNTPSLDDFDKDFLKTYTGFNAGILLRINLPLGFEIQPELLYVQSGGQFQSDGVLAFGSANVKLYDGSLRLPVNIQWGIELFNVVKPYVFVSPFIGYTLFQNVEGWNDITNTTEKMSLEPERLQYGIGLGIGVNVWKLQVAFKWNWNLNKTLVENTPASDFLEVFDKENMKYNGGELSIAFIF